MPNRQDIDPVEIPRCLPNVWIFRRENETAEFICELCGEAIQGDWNRRLVGQSAREIMAPRDYEIAYSRWSTVLERPALCHSIRKDDGRLRLACRLSLPLRDKDGGNNVILGISHLVYERPHTPPQDQINLGAARFFDPETLEEILDMGPDATPA